MEVRPNYEQQRTFLLRIYFGAEDEENGFTNRAYRDMSRTLHGLSKLGNKEALKTNARNVLKSSLTELAGLTPSSQNSLEKGFDDWHGEACLRVVKAFGPKTNEFSFHYGQAQKWLNMTVKYRWFFSSNNELGEWHRVAHIAVDDLVLNASKECGIKRPTTESWSRWNEDQYKSFQSDIREYANQHNKTPLALEHEWWMQQSQRLTA